MSKISLRDIEFNKGVLVYSARLFEKLEILKPEDRPYVNSYFFPEAVSKCSNYDEIYAYIKRRFKREINDYSIRFAVNCWFNNQVMAIFHFGHISTWDVSNVTDMSELFMGRTLTDDISMWNVSNVRNMKSMFRESNFTGDISSWDVTRVIDMSYMFVESNFDGDINSWDICMLKNANSMFSCSIFNKPLDNWDVTYVEDMRCMFLGNEFFNQDLTSWMRCNIIQTDLMLRTSYPDQQDFKRVRV